MTIKTCDLAGLLIIEPKVFGDPRGFFMEMFNAKRYADLGVASGFVQDNLSFSRKGTLRGLHFQNPAPQGKLVTVLQGEVYDVAVDLRRGSSTFGRHHGLVLGEDNRLQFYIPPGFAHGFQVLSETALFFYKCTELYSPKDELGVRWDDPALGIPWPLPSPIVSAKDSAASRLADLPADRLFD